MKSPALLMLHHVVDFLTALCAVHVGLLAFGYDVFTVQFLMNFGKFFGYVWGVAGVLSLVFMFGMHGMFCDCRGCSSCQR